jgi:HlyD family secretion protein
VIVGIVVVALIAGAAWFLEGNEATAGEPYRMAAIERGDIEETIASTGTVTALLTVAVGTQVSGRVIELHADFNDQVRVGQLIARIDPTIQQQQVRNAESNLLRAQADLRRAQQEYDRNKVLYDQQVITESEFIQVEYSLTVSRASVTSAEINLEQARQNLAYTEIYSPIDGVVIERNAEVGQTVAASLSAPQLFLLARDLRDLEIHASVDESEIGRIQPDQLVRFTVQAYDDEEFEGRVRQVRLQSATQENVVNYRVVISVENPDLRLLPGMTATVDFVVQRAEDVFKVSNAALRFTPTPEMLAELGDEALAAGMRPGGPNSEGGMAARAGDQTAEGGAARQVPAGGAAEGGAAGSVGGDGGGAGAGVGGGAGNGAAAGGAGGRAGRAAGGQGFRPGAGGGLGTEAGNGANAAVQAGFARARPGAAGRGGFATLWYLKDGELAVMPVRTGISDGVQTQIMGPELEEGIQVIAGLNIATPERATQQTTNPFQEQRGGFQQGRGGGGGQVRFGPGGF